MQDGRNAKGRLKQNGSSSASQLAVKPYALLFPLENASKSKIICPLKQLDRMFRMQDIHVHF